MTKRKTLGNWGEAQAAAYLSEKGYEIIGRNLRNEHGEIDILARQGAALVFVEVKTRSSTRFGYPEEAVTETKAAHLVAAAEAYLSAHPELLGDWRIDVVAIRRRAGRTPEIVHIENALN